MVNLELWRNYTREVETALSPACDVLEDENKFLLSFDLPGFKKEDLNIEQLGKRISVSGKRNRELAENAKFHRAERNYGEFKRIFTLPDNARSETLEANYADGVLYLSIPKAEVDKPKKVAIA